MDYCPVWEWRRYGNEKVGDGEWFIVKRLRVRLVEPECLCMSTVVCVAGLTSVQSLRMGNKMRKQNL